MRLAREGADLVLTYERDSESAAKVIDQIKGVMLQATSSRP
jgi:hypothetical protein